jgi:hypothetical protein
VNAESWTDHLNRKTYGAFTLTDAVRPGPTLPVRPRQGYTLQVYRDRKAGLKLPMISAAVSAENLMDCFLALLDPLGDSVHVVLETSHGRDADDHMDYRRTHIDLPVLASHFCEFEDLLLNDGCTGVAVLSARGRMEVQFDEHKLLHIYSTKINPFRRVLRDFGIRRRKDLPLISDAEHLHHTTDDHEETFEQLCLRVGVADFEMAMSDE